MAHDDEIRPDAAARPGDARHASPPQRAFDDPPRASRAPLVFGIVAATLQMGALLWLAKCR